MKGSTDFVAIGITIEKSYSQKAISFINLAHSYTIYIFNFLNYDMLVASVTVIKYIVMHIDAHNLEPIVFLADHYY